jgi:hypothetical protein
MDYSKIYNSLIQSRVSQKEARLLLKKEGGYFENHHIIPKSKGGDSSRDNLVLLTAREHFLAHWLLWRIYRDRSSALAFHKMISNNKYQKRSYSSRGYEEARLAFSETNKGNKYGSFKKEYRASDETRSKISKNHADVSGNKNPFYGKKHTEEVLEKIRAFRRGCANDMIHNYKGYKLIYKDGIFICKFKSSKEVATYIGCSMSNVRHVLSGNQKTAKGFTIIHEK